jgi:hypothetical protein
MNPTLDADERLDDFDPKYFPKKVFRDGKGPRVTLVLTDGMPAYRPRPVFDARNHRPHFADLTVARLQDGLKQAAEARSEWIKGLQDAWRTPTGGAGGAPVTTAPPSDQPDDDDDNLSPRDRYVLSLQNAYKTGSPYVATGNRADDIEAQRQRWLKPGARPGTNDGFARSSPDAAAGRALADQAYAEYCGRLRDGWRR